MLDRTRPLFLVLLLAACGGGGGSSDAGTDSGPGPDAQVLACAEFGSPAGSIDTFPGIFTGDLFGAGADLYAPAGRCTDERDWYEPEGEDQVVALTGLTPGALYGVIVNSTADLSFYVATGCGDGEPLAGQCLLFVDTVIGGGERAEFTAPAAGSAFLVIDNFDPGLPDGEAGYTVTVTPAECVGETDCTSAAAPHCADYTCVECVTAFDCEAAAPACDGTNTCVASLDECTDDDVAEPDDGPTDAATLTVPTAGVPTVVPGSICNAPAGEGDWLELVLVAETELGFSLTWPSASGADIDVVIWDPDGEFVDGGLNFGTDPEALRVTLDAGTYYLQVNMFEPAAVTAAVDYTLTVLLPECDDSFQCTVAADPVCDGAGLCGDGPSQCVGDDAADDGDGDDGPYAGRSLAGAVNTAVTLSDGLVCNVPFTEGDWYIATTGAAGQGLTLDLTWTGPAVDLDLQVFDAEGNILGVSYYGSEEEHVELARLPASSSVYIQVLLFAQEDVVDAVGYSITSTRHAANACTVDADCDDEYSTQFLRGDCVSGGCAFIDGAAALDEGDACDSGDDCTSGFCSYIAFESDAAASVCTVSCTATAACTTALGAGYTCLTGLATNFCVPACTEDLECGADVGSGTPDDPLPWDYLTCTPASGVCNF